MTYSLLRKKPPNSMKGMTTGGPIDSAMDTLLEMHEIRYPAERRRIESERLAGQWAAARRARRATKGGSAAGATQKTMQEKV